MNRGLQIASIFFFTKGEPGHLFLNIKNALMVPCAATPL